VNRRRLILGCVLVLAIAASAAAQEQGVAAGRVEGSSSILRGESAYDGAGKRDPFRPFITEPPKHAQLTPLQKFDLGQLKVAGIISGPSMPRAMVEDGGGMGYIVAVGTPMGPNGGVVTAILPGRIVVEESVTDFYGKPTTHRVVLAVPSDDGDKGTQKR
jgi:type IV pilus assembly protein PilP